MFKPAERRKSKLRLALCGASGSGKTYSAILVSKGISDKVALIDTENGSGDLYADIAKYDVARLLPPYTPDRYIELIKGAEKAGYEVLIIDSLSHAWAGDGGILDMHDKVMMSQKTSSSFNAWRNITPIHNKLVNTILQSDMHIIATMRSKTAYETVVNDKGKVQPVKIGLAPIQRDGLDYEFTVVFHIGLDGHVATASKDRTGIFDGKHIIPSEETGKLLLDWLNSGVECDPERHLNTIETISLEEAKGKIDKYCQQLASCENEDDLKMVFSEGKNLFLQYPDLMKAFIAQKDACKEVLSGK